MGGGMGGEGYGGWEGGGGCGQGGSGASLVIQNFPGHPTPAVYGEW